MFNVGLGELLLFMIIALIVLGPEQLPQALRTSLNFYRKLKHLVQKVQDDVEKELKISELQDLMSTEFHKIKIKEQELQQQLEQLHQELAELNQNKIQILPKNYITITPANQQYLKAPFILIQKAK